MPLIILGNLETCVTKSFKKKTDFIVQLNEQVKKKENSILKSRSQMFRGSEGGIKYKSSTKVFLAITCTGVVILILLKVFHYLQRKWERQKELELLLKSTSIFSIIFSIGFQKSK